MKELQSPRDHVLWMLGESGGKLSISRLRSQTDLLKYELDAILEDLEREDKIIINRKMGLLKS